MKETDGEAREIEKLLEGNEPTFEYLLKCIFKLTTSEIEVYFALHKNPGVGVDELAEMLGKDRSGVYRSLQTLLEKGLVSREYRILKQGGYKYLYVPLPLEELKKRLKLALEKWFAKLNCVIDAFNLDMPLRGEDICKSR
ncbi:putative transcriptional regulator [Archaeoglobus fulgidus DSM 8774]|uniref:Putative transcriptional regulator n=1 Tax=Archaeoglobus fulgidus DSM 8774 TaxID=1344584 RepID=A0A075WCM1_ARCFL|nr:helix-turn-helix domain-containing protein [Archaeoglobus fulgidus]AIG98140.1 putative transcriptional regulator [Archaeoglobus fulgidus DSM 8774]